jgi:hypothetical protein
MSVFDLPNIIGLQQKLIQDLSGNSQMMNTLGLKVGELNNAVSKSNANIMPTLTKQQEVGAVLTREEERLRDRKQAIDTAGDEQKRLVDLTRNATQRTRAINNMYIVAVVGLFIYLGIRFVTGILPEIVTDVLNVLVVSITILTILKMYADYTRRNNMDFDMINLGEPSEMVGNKSGSGSAGSAGAGLIGSRIGGGCEKDACCPEGTKYNEKYAICVPNEAPYSKVTPGEPPTNYAYFMPNKEWKLKSTCSGKTTYSFDELGCKANTETFTTMKTSDMAKANEPFEFADYNLYK